MTPTVVRIISTSLADLSQPDRTDGQLLELFVRKHDHEAFAALVRRHGPMVLGVCRRVLRNSADADDAFQAAFLVLARKAASLGRREFIAAWLHGVAFNTARKLRHANARRATRETPIAELQEPPALQQQESHAELLAVLDEELNRLPERYRAPILLCDLQGATRKEAAAALGCPEGTVAGRLARARAMLAQRLAGRGVAPAAGVLAVLTDRAAAAALVGEVLRGVSEGVVSPRVAGLTEGVLSAMFAKKLRTVAAAVLLTGLVFAGAVGLFQAATAQPDPNPLGIPPGEKSAPKPAAAGTKVFTAVPLKNTEREGRAVVEAIIEAHAERYKGGSNFAILLVEQKTLLIYADEETTKATLATLRKLGEEPGRIPTVFPLGKDADGKAIASTLMETFGGSRRVWVQAVPGDGALLVYATPTDTLLIRQLLGKVLLAEPAPAPEKAPTKPAEAKQYTVNFRNAPWVDVLDWYAKISGLTPVFTDKPVGTVTLAPPKDRLFTLGEVTDLLNEAMIQQKFILIRREQTFTLHPSDQRIDVTMIPRIKLEDLPERGKTELVWVLVPLKTLAVEEVAPEVQKLLTPFGLLSMLAKTNTLVIVDTAGNISRIVETLKDVEESNTRDDMGTYRCRWVKAKDLADQLRLFFDTLPLGRDAAGGSPKSGDQYGRGGYDPWNDPRNDPRGGGRSVGRLKSVAITVDERTNSLTITAPPEKLMLARKLIEELDKPAKPGDPPITLPDPVLKRYSVPPGTADEMAKTLQKEHPSLRVLAVPNQNEILVLGTPAEHLLVDIAVGTKKKESEKK